MIDYLLSLLAFIGLTMAGTAGWALLEHIGDGGYPGGTKTKLAARFGLSAIVGLAAFILAGIPDIYYFIETLRIAPVVAIGLIGTGYWVLDAFEELVKLKRRNGG